MPKLLQLHFAFHGPFGQEMADQLGELAASINQEPGFLWKVWTESEQNQEAGGIYLFENEETALAYLDNTLPNAQAACLVRRCSTLAAAAAFWQKVWPVKVPP